VNGKEFEEKGLNEIRGKKEVATKCLYNAVSRHNLHKNLVRIDY
jgi:hypothetical protein